MLGLPDKAVNAEQSDVSDDARKKVELVEKALSLLGNKGRSDNAVSSIQKLITEHPETLDFITDIPSAGNVVKVFGHIDYMSKTFNRYYDRLEKLGLIESVAPDERIKEGALEAIILKKFLTVSPSVDGDRAQAVLDALKGVYIQEQQVDVTNRSFSDRLMGRR